jgi:ribosome-binding protein aMBF1 (putative translation factor)
MKKGVRKKTKPGDLIDDLLSKITPEFQEEVDYRMNLAAKIYWGMKAKGWTQKIFAEEMEKKDSVISRWLSGTHNFETDTLFKIEKKLGIRLLDLKIDFPGVKHKVLAPRVKALHK